MSRAWRLGACATVVLLMAATPALADIEGAPADTIATGYGPIAPGTVYDGRFVSEGDVDYLLVDVASPGLTYRFDLRNTVGPCLSPDLTPAARCTRRSWTRTGRSWAARAAAPGADR